MISKCGTSEGKLRLLFKGGFYTVASNHQALKPRNLKCYCNGVADNDNILGIDSPL